MLENRSMVESVQNGEPTLYKLGDLSNFKRLGHGVPTLRHANPPQFALARSITEYRNRLHNTAPWLNGFDFEKYGLVLAGGAATHILVSSERVDSDYDLFLIGHKSDDEAKEAITALGYHLSTRIDNLTNSRTVGCVTFTGLDTAKNVLVEVQVVLRRQKTISELLHGFDLGSSSVAFDGKDVYLTRAGKFAVEQGANILTPGKRRSSYETRLHRYFGRGFDIVLPHLDVVLARGNSRAKIRELQLPFAKICFDPSGSCVCCFVGRFQPLWKNSEGSYYGEKGSSYGKINYLSESAILLGNLRALSKARGFFNGSHIPGLCAQETYKGSDVWCYIQPRLDMNVWASCVSCCFTKSSIKHKQLVTLLGPKQAARAVIKSIKVGGAPHRKDLMRMCEARQTELLGFDRLKEKVMSDFVKIPLRSDILKIPLTFDAMAINKYFPLKKVSEKQWYGEYYSK
jgi:hypothetical protein